MSEEQGRMDFNTYKNSPAYMGFQDAHKIRAEDAMKLFWPPVNESMTQIQSPYPKPRVEWMKGWRLEQFQSKVIIPS
jgi:hypothetical protein